MTSSLASDRAETPSNTSPNKVPATSPHKVHPARQITSSLPRDVVSTASAHRLQLALANALRPRGFRKELRAPRRPTAAAYQRSRGRSTGSAYAAARRYLVRLALRALNDVTGEGLDLPTALELERALDAHVSQQLRFLIRTQAPGEPSPSGFERWAYLDSEGADRVARDSARAALSEWDASWIEHQRELGRQGGRISKRPPTWDDESLLVLSLLEGMTLAQQAEILNQSERTVSRMRALLASLPEA